MRGDPNITWSAHSLVIALCCALALGCAEGAVQTELDVIDATSGSDADATRADTTPSDVTAECGNGVPEPGEDCDNGNDNSDTRPNACRTDCRAAGCGDGVVDGGESCDDGNSDDNDGCLSSCKSLLDVICQPCAEDFECGRSVDRCTDLPGSKSCTVACVSDDDCPDGFSCDTPEGGDSNQCLPDGGACVDCFDPDNDNYGTGVGCLGSDCDQDNGTIYEGATEQCDGVDNNCDGEVDEGFSARSYWPDFDNDTYGDTYAEPKVRCTPIAGHVENDLDCDDQNASIKPGVADPCDGIDNDCDDQVDDADDCPCAMNWLDGDAYLFCDSPASWADASAACAASGYQLAYVNDAEENTWLRDKAVFNFEHCEDTCQYARDGACDDGGEGSVLPVCALGTDCGDCGGRPIDAFWFGLSDLDEEGVYLWSDGQAPDYLRWATGEPSATSEAEDCAEMLTGPHDWNDRVCDALQPYVCKSPARPTRPGQEEE